MAEEQETPKIQIDTDWKLEAQREKERLARKEAEKAHAAGGEKKRPHELPDANFRSLIGLLASQAILGLGALGDEKTGRIIIDLDGARFNIDLLEILEQKTNGNLTEEESKELQQVLTELRARYVQISQFVAKQVAATPPSGSRAETLGSPKKA